MSVSELLPAISHTEAPAIPDDSLDILTPFILSKRTRATRRAYAADVNDFAQSAGLRTRADLLRVRPDDVAGYRDFLMAAGRKPSSIARKLAALRAMYDYAIARGWLDHNPADSALVAPPRAPQESATQGLTREEVRALLAAIDRSKPIGKRDYAILRLMLFHALRREELVNLRTSSFGSERHHVTLTIAGKGGKVRKHPVAPETVEAVEDFLAATGRTLEGDEPLFRPARNTRTGDTAKAISTEAVALIVRRHCRRAGIAKRITPHSLRHTSITNALDNGATVRRVTHFAGHADPKTTLRYDRDRHNLDDNAARAIAY